MCTDFWTARALMNEKYDEGYLYTINNSSRVYLSFFPSSYSSKNTFVTKCLLFAEFLFYIHVHVIDSSNKITKDKMKTKQQGTNQYTMNI